MAGVVTRREFLYRRVAGCFVPFGLSAAYSVLIACAFHNAEGGFGSLQGVRALFQSDWLLVAGWVHYLAFDLFVASWIAGKTFERGLTRLILVAVLPLTFLFGPVGLATFGVIDSIVAAATRSTWGDEE